MSFISADLRVKDTIQYFHALPRTALAKKGKKSVLRRCYTRRFATTIFKATKWEQCCANSKKSRNKVASLCCAENRGCEFLQCSLPYPERCPT